jgi:hypothetical protein
VRGWALASAVAARIPVLRTVRGEIIDARRHRARVRELHTEVRALRKEVRQLARAERNRLSPLESREASRRMFAILQRIYDDEPGNRRRLAELRASETYSLAFSEPQPLVSVIIPTYTNVTGLVSTALPSVLEQTYQNFEVLVIGDCAPAETAEALSAFDDSRIVYVNRERRGPYPSDPDAAARVKGAPPFNVGVRLAQGRWIAPFADDDLLRTTHLELLVGAARENRYEFCYGRAQKNGSDGTTAITGEWPPELGRVALQASIYHSGLTFIEHELVDGLFRTSSDKSILRRMLNAGVRFGFIDDIVVDYSWRRPAPNEDPRALG